MFKTRLERIYELIFGIFQAPLPLAPKCSVSLNEPSCEFVVLESLKSLHFKLD